MPDQSSVPSIVTVGNLLTIEKERRHGVPDSEGDSGFVNCVHADGTCDIRFTISGAVEKNVHPSRILNSNPLATSERRRSSIDDDVITGPSLLSPNYAPLPRDGRISPTTVAADISTITANNTSTLGDNDFQSLTNLTVSSSPNAKIITSDPSSQRLTKNLASPRPHKRQKSYHSFPPVHSQNSETASVENDTIVAVGKHIIELWRNHDFSGYSISSKLCLDEKKCSFSECNNGQCLQIILVSSRFTNEVSSLKKEILSYVKDKYRSMSIVLRTPDEWNRMKSLMRSQA